MRVSALRQQALNDGLLVLLGLVLTDLPLALHAAHTQLDADDVCQQLVGVISGGVGHAPGVSLTGLVLVGQLGDELPHLLWVMDGVERAMCVHHGVVPRGDDLAGLVLGGVPVGRDVGGRALENGQQFLVRRHLPEWVVPGDMAQQLARTIRRGLEQERHMVGRQAIGILANDGAQGELRDEVVQLGWAIFLKVGGAVHGSDGCASAATGLRAQVLLHEPTDACAVGLKIAWIGGPDYNKIGPDWQYRGAQRRLLGGTVEQLGWGLRQELASGFSP